MKKASDKKTETVRFYLQEAPGEATVTGTASRMVAARVGVRSHYLLGRGPVL